MVYYFLALLAQKLQDMVKRKTTKEIKINKETKENK